MRLLHTPGAVEAVFDDQRLISYAGLEPVMRLAEQCGLRQRVRQKVRLPGPVGANPGGKVATIVAGMLTDADSIDDLDRVRHGGMGLLFDDVYAPSTLGSFLRAFTHGHVRQLESACRQVLVELAARTQAHDQTGLPIIVALEATDPDRLRWTALAVLDDTDTVLDTDDHKRRWHAWLYWTNLTQFLALGGGDGVQLAASAAAQFEVDVLAMDLGESLVDTARRETAEETGVQVQITGLVGIYTDPKHVILYTSNGEVRQEFSVVYTARPIGGAPTPSDESREVRWVAPADVASLPMDRSMWMRIAHYLGGSETPHLG